MDFYLILTQHMAQTNIPAVPIRALFSLPPRKVGRPSLSLQQGLQLKKDHKEGNEYFLILDQNMISFRRSMGWAVGTEVIHVYILKLY